MFLPKVPTHVNVQQCSTMSMFIRRSEKDLSSYYYCTQYICDICRKTGRKPPQEYNYVVFRVSKSFLPITRVLGPLHKKASSTCISLAYCCITQKLRNYSNFRKISINLPCAPLLLLRLRSLPLPCPLPLLPVRKKEYITFKTVFHLLVFIPLLHSRSTV